MSQLIMLSGGLDSTYLLKKALVETDQTVFVHHIHLVNHEDRHEAERVACEDIVDYCQRAFRPFHYSESTINRVTMNGFIGYDLMTAAFEAGIAAVNFQATVGERPWEWFLGDCAEDSDNDMIHLPGRYEGVVGATAAGAWPHVPPRFVRFTGPPKREIVEYLGHPLANMCWTCRYPTRLEGEFIECGMCRTCKVCSEIDLK